MRHRPWCGLDVRALHEELVEAMSVLERAVGRPVTRAACPFGASDRRVLRTLRGSGYQHVYTSDRGTAGSATSSKPATVSAPTTSPVCSSGSPHSSCPPTRRWAGVRCWR